MYTRAKKNSSLEIIQKKSYTDGLQEQARTLTLNREQLKLTYGDDTGPDERVEDDVVWETFMYLRQELPKWSDAEIIEDNDDEFEIRRSIANPQQLEGLFEQMHIEQGQQLEGG